MSRVTFRIGNGKGDESPVEFDVEGSVQNKLDEALLRGAQVSREHDNRVVRVFIDGGLSARVVAYRMEEV